MAIEQSKAPGNDMRSQASKTVVHAARNKAAGAQDTKAGAGFAAVLASTDADVAPSGAEALCGSSGPMAVTKDAADGQKPELSSRASTVQQPDKATAVRPAKKADTDGAQKSTRKTDDTDLERFAPLATAGSGQAPLTTSLQALVPLQVNEAPMQNQESASADNTLAPVVGGATGRGYMRTNQLQQTLAMAADRNAGGRTLAGGAVSASVTVDTMDTTAANSALPGMVVDLRQAAMGKASGSPEILMDSGAKMMNLMASVASQTDHGSRERHGQEDMRGAGSALQDAWTAESADATGQATGGFSMEDAPVQETVRYWVGADTKQQAELTVNDVGGGSVDVTIHMHGKEAQVSFRADEQQARDALQAASSQLKQMLDQEGLTLSGMSVGTSSAGQDGRQEPRPGGGSAKTTKVAAVNPDPVLPPAGATTSPSAFAGRGRTLDLFV